MCNIFYIVYIYIYILSLQYLHHSTCILNNNPFTITQLSKYCKRYFHSEHCFWMFFVIHGRKNLSSDHIYF